MAGDDSIFTLSSSSPTFGRSSGRRRSISFAPSFSPPSPPPNKPDFSFLDSFASASSPSASSNGVADTKQKTSKATAESPSLMQTSNGVVPKPAVEEASDEFEPCETMDGGPHIFRSGSLKGVETKDTKNGSESLPTESTGKSEKFTYTRILRGITHNPHFTPLQSYSKRSREKLIVGWDELFVETIDHIQSLTTKTFSTNVRELWKTIAELENLGYNVARLKKRLDELTDMMKKRDSSEIDVSDLRAKADDYRKEKKRIEEDIADLQAQADKAQVMVYELVDQADKMESNLPTVDTLFENVAKNPL